MGPAPLPWKGREMTERTMTDEEFRGIYWRVDSIAPMEWNSADVEREVARITGLSADDVWLRVHRLFHGGEG